MVIMERWAGKTAVVTGASAGIGAAICVQLAGAAMRVLGLARRPQLVEELNKQVSGSGKIYARQCDIGNPEEIASAFKWAEEQFGGVDILVNNAAQLANGSITEVGGNPVTDEAIQQIVGVNVAGTVLCTRHAVASMKRRGVAGHIVNINSVVGHYLPVSTMVNVYPMTKHAITAFTGALTQELATARANIKTTSISPGLVDTLMAKELIGIVPEGLPMLRPDDVANAVLYVIASPPHMNISELTIANLNELRA